MEDTYSFGRPVHVPEGPLELREHVRAVLDAFLERIVKALEVFVTERDAEALLRVEEALRQLLGLAAAHLAGGLVAWLHRDSAWAATMVARSRQADERKLRHRGSRETEVRFLGGERLQFTTPYLSVNRKGQPGRSRGVGRRGEAGGGSYPVLEALGIHDQATPALASEAVRETVR